MDLIRAGRERGIGKRICVSNGPLEDEHGF